jgi:hypothetical protein
MTAEGPPHVRGDDGVEARAGMPAGAQRREPEGLARPRSAEAAEEHSGDFEEGGQLGRWRGRSNADHSIMRTPVVNDRPAPTSGRPRSA